MKTERISDGPSLRVISGSDRGAGHSVSFGPFCLHDRDRLLEKDGAPVRLGSRAFDVLRVLVGRAGEVVSKEELIASVWSKRVIEESSLRVHIADLRKALEDGRDGARYVMNVSGRGYCFVAPIHRVTDLPPKAAPGTSIPHGLPYRLERMVGRDHAVQELAERLGTSRFITLHGPGGIGKTTVATALAHQVSGDFSGEIRFLDLATLRESDLVASALASTLGLPVPSADPTPSVVSFLRDRRMLLIFDSCEHVIGAAARLAEQIYQHAPRVSILATSRESLLVDGEQVYELPPLDVPPEGASVSAADVLNFPSAQLFMERAAASGYRAEMTDDDAAAVAEICRKLDGIALAIELAAVRVRAHGLQATAALLDGRLKLEWRGRRTAAPRHQALNAALDWSYNLTTDSERAVLRRLATLTKPFTLQQALAVAAEDEESRECVVEALEQLVAKSLVCVQSAPAQTRYRLMEITRSYALQKQLLAEERSPICQTAELRAARRLQDGLSAA